MNALRKLPNQRRHPPGLEWWILRRLPVFLAGATYVPLLVVLGSHLMPPEGSAVEVAKHLKLISIVAVASVITAWTAAFTVTIGCITVVLMKGPGYVADAYELNDRDAPE